MGPLLGALAFVFIICALLWLTRGIYKVTPAMWVPLVWLLIASSRPLSNWLSLSGPGGVGSAYTEGSPLDRNVLTILLVLGLVALYKRTKPIKPTLAANPLLIAYFAYCLISIIWCDYPLVLFKRWIRSVGDIVVILIVITEPKWEDALKWLFTRISFVLVPLSILLIRFYPSLGRAYSRGGSPQWTGVGTDKNALGMLCMIYGAALLWYGIRTYKNRHSLTRTRELLTVAAVFAMIVYLVLVVDSKTALACFVMSDVLIIMTTLRPGFRKPIFVTAVVATMIAICYCVLFLGIGGGALNALGRDSSLTGRTEVWQTVLPYATNAWLGAGYENFWVGERMELFDRLLGGLNQAHNGYIEIYLNLGWVGVALLAAIIAGGYRKIIKALRYDPGTSGLKLAFFFICLVYNFTEASFKMQSPVWIFFLWAVIAAPLTSRSPKSRKFRLAAKHSELATPDDVVSPSLISASTLTPTDRCARFDEYSTTGISGRGFTLQPASTCKINFAQC
jgi:exopolysaccharide production protein ExoQ